MIHSFLIEKAFSVLFYFIFFLKAMCRISGELSATLNRKSFIMIIMIIIIISALLFCEKN